MNNKTIFAFFLLLIFPITCFALEVVETSITSGLNDAEENIATGEISLASSDLELAQESAAQFVGLRFINISIPQGVNITNAWIQFTVDEITDEVTDLIIAGERTANAEPFTSETNNISARALTMAAVEWTPPHWTDEGDQGLNQQTPNIKDVVQEIITQSEWSAGNSMVFVFGGVGKRVAESYDGASVSAATLRVEYTTMTTTSITFSWLPNNPEDGHTGYSVHYGTATGTYTVTSDAALPEPVDGRIYHTVPAIPEGETLFFAATAYNNVGDRSGYSNEIEHTVPITSGEIPDAPVDMRIE